MRAAAMQQFSFAPVSVENRLGIAIDLERPLERLQLPAQVNEIIVLATTHTNAARDGLIVWLHLI